MAMEKNTNFIPGRNGTSGYKPAPKAAHMNSGEGKPPSGDTKYMKKQTSTNSQKAGWRQSLAQIKNRLLAPRQNVGARRQQIMLALVVVLSVVFVIVWVLPTFKSLSAAEQKPAFEPPPTVQTSTVDIDWKLPPPYPEKLRDPMKFGETSDVGDNTSLPVVTGILYSENRKSALIGGKILTVGDTVSGYKITRINRDTVEFKKNEEKKVQKVSRN